MLTFEPFSCAVVACAVEHLICCNRPSIPRARIWIRRNSESVVDLFTQEITEPLLDATKGIDISSALGAVALLLIAKMVLALVALYRNRT